MKMERFLLVEVGMIIEDDWQAVREADDEIRLAVFLRVCYWVSLATLAWREVAG